MGTLKSAPKYAPNGVFERLLTAAELETMTKRQRNQYEAALRNYRDNLADKETTRIRIKQARAEGFMIGYAKGFEESIQESCAKFPKEVRAIIREVYYQELIERMHREKFTEYQINSILSELRDTYGPFEIEPKTPEKQSIQ